MLTKTNIKYYCPWCGREVQPEDETEMGIVCENKDCSNDFWLSECIKKEGDRKC